MGLSSGIFGIFLLDESPECVDKILKNLFRKSLMHKMLSFLFCFFAIILLSCARVPDAIDSPSLKVDYSIENNSEVFTVFFSGGLRNENSDIVFSEVTGSADFYVKGNSQPVERISFYLKEIMPFETGIIEAEEARTKESITGFLGLMELDRSQIVSDGTSGGFFPEPGSVTLSNLKFKKIPINKYIRGKVNEENK